MDLPNILLLLVVFLNAGLGAVVLARDWRHPPYQCFGAFAASVSLWALALLLFRATTHDGLAILFLKSSYVAATLIGVTLFAFAHVFPDRMTIGRGSRLLVGFATLLFVVLLLTPGFLVHQLRPAPYGKSALLGVPEYLLFAGVFLGCFGGGLTRIAAQMRGTSGLVRLQLRYIFWGVLLPGILGIIFNLVLPSPFFANFHWIWVGPLCSVLMVTAVATAIVKYHFLQIKVIISEVLTTLLVGVTLVQVVLAPTLSGRLVQLAILLIALVLGFLLMRSVLEEVHRRQKLQQLTDTLHYTNRELERLDAARMELLALVTHQLRAPLTTLKGDIALLQATITPKLTPHEQQSLETVAVAHDQLMHVVDDLVDAARIEDGRMVYLLSTVDVLPMIEQIVEALRPQAAMKHLTVRLAIPAHVPRLSVDPEKIRQVFFTLIDNALQSTSAGTVTVSLRVTEETLRFEVHDTGVGMTPAAQRQLFQQVSQERGTATRPLPGTGLGLAVAKHVVDTHHGRIWAESPGRGQGSRFVVVLPIAEHAALPTHTSSVPSSPRTTAVPRLLHSP